MSTIRVKLILNPIAGKGSAAARIPEVESLFKSRHIDYSLCLTQSVGHAQELARDSRKEGFDLVVAAGGDGTVNEVVNGLMRSGAKAQDRPAFGVLSIGRGNDFAYGADIPVELKDCVEAIAEGISRPLDVGRVAGGDYPEGRYFGNGIGVGFDTIVGLEAAKMKHVHGFMAYVFGALRTFIMYPEAPEVRLEIEGSAEKAIEGQSHQISILNGKRMGGTFFMAPRASNFDGLLDLCMAPRLTRGDMIGLMLRYTKGTQAENPKMVTTRASRFSIQAPKGGLVVHADGETITINGTSIEVDCVPAALRIVYDPETAALRSAIHADIPEPLRFVP
jgi:diacylglycerol kinase (ATP)